MLTRCIVCQRDFAPNHELQYAPVSRRLAFDPQRGRLWCICNHCQGWTLQPIEQRWEALEELERLTRDRAKLLIQGENIALLRAGPLEFLRIGKAGLPEESWWRYGDELSRRRQRAGKIARRGKIIDALIASVIAGFPIWYGFDPAPWIAGARLKAFGKIAWQGSGRCLKCGNDLNRLPFKESVNAQVQGTLRDLSLRLPCTCSPQGGVQLDGVAATNTLRRLLAWHNFTGGNQDDVLRAATQVESAAGSDLLRQLFPGKRSLGELPAVNSLSLEIALNHDVERALLQMELAELQARWREEETIAAIVDRELT